jgi:hypothetical protein
LPLWALWDGGNNVQFLIVARFLAEPSQPIVASDHCFFSNSPNRCESPPDAWYSRSDFLKTLIPLASNHNALNRCDYECSRLPRLPTSDCNSFSMAWRPAGISIWINSIQVEFSFRLDIYSSATNLSFLLPLLPFLSTFFMTWPPWVGLGFYR